jgi:hypothetical protein
MPREVFLPREELIAALPGALEHALAAYREALARPSAEEPRAFAAQQAACKSALMHIEALLKLARGLEDERLAATPEPSGGEAGESQEQALARLLAEARAELSRGGTFDVEDPEG